MKIQWSSRRSILEKTFVQFFELIFSSDKMFQHNVAVVDLRGVEPEPRFLFHFLSFSEDGRKPSVIGKMRPQYSEKMFRLPIEKEFKRCNAVKFQPEDHFAEKPFGRMIFGERGEIVPEVQVGFLLRQFIERSSSDVVDD